MERDGWMCSRCSAADKTLHVHHKWYEANSEPWEVLDGCLITLCEDCHAHEHQNIGQANRAIVIAMNICFSSDEIKAIADAIFSLRHKWGDGLILNFFLGGFATIKDKINELSQGEKQNVPHR